MNYEEAIQYDQQAKRLAKDYLSKEAEILTHLSEMQKNGIFAVLNFSGIFEYCERELKFSYAQAGYFSKVAQVSAKVPELYEAVLTGELTVSQGRRIAPILTPENQKEWIEKAKTLRQGPLEREVAKINPNARIKEQIKPVAREIAELRTAVDPKTEANIQALRDILSQKTGKPASVSDVIAWATEVCREKHDPERKAERSVSSRKPSTPKTGRHPIPASVKHEVVRRDKNQCTHVTPDGRRCQQRRWLQFHHVREVSRGGLNTTQNLKTMCSAHHRLKHDTISSLHEVRGHAKSDQS